jgi:hypothetical protein
MLVRAKLGSQEHSSTTAALGSHIATTWHECNSSNAWAQAPAVPELAKNRINVCSLSAALQSLFMRLQSC